MELCQRIIDCINQPKNKQNLITETSQISDYKKIFAR
jgi:hypothetical protein